MRPWPGSDLGPLDECLASGTLVEERGRVSFRHELARLVIEDAIPPARRVALHRAALRALMASPAGSTDPARLAHHAEQANDSGAVLALAPAAGDRAAEVGAHREAAGQYGRALRFAESLPLEARAHLHERHSYENYLSDRPDQALDARRQALAIYRTLGDRRGEGESLCWLARLLFFSSRDAEADEAGEPRSRSWRVCRPAGNSPWPTAPSRTCACWPAICPRPSAGASGRSYWPSASARPRFSSTR